MARGWRNGLMAKEKIFEEIRRRYENSPSHYLIQKSSRPLASCRAAGDGGGVPCVQGAPLTFSHSASSISIANAHEVAPHFARPASLSFQTVFTLFIFRRLNNGDNDQTSDRMTLHDAFLKIINSMQPCACLLRSRGRAWFTRMQDELLSSLVSRRSGRLDLSQPFSQILYFMPRKQEGQPAEARMAHA